MWQGVFKWVSDFCLTPNAQLYSYITARTSYIRWGDDDVLDQHMISALYLNKLNCICIVLAQWNNNPRIDISHYRNTLSWFPTIKLLIFLLSVSCLAGKQNTPILQSLDWHDRGSNNSSAALEARMLTTDTTVSG